jgi:hypothetical protein
MAKKRFGLCLILVMLTGWLSPVRAQSFAVKTNLIYDATATVNVGMEVGLAPRWTFDLSGNLNTWSKNEYTKWKHWMVQPEARYWFCDRFSRHFIGAHLLTGAFNFGNIDNNIFCLGTDFSVLSDYRYQGYAYGGGLAYGFAFVLSKHLNLELEVGAGYVYLDYEKFECADCGRKVGEGNHHYVGPTKAAINLVYLF